MLNDGLTLVERMKKWFPRRKLIIMAAATLIYGLLYWWASVDRSGYFNVWLAERRWWEFWVVALALTAIGLWGAGAGLTAGSVIAIPIARFMGDKMDAYYATVITPDMTAEELAAYSPRHAYMWWIFVVIFIVVGLIVQLILRVIRKRKEAMMPY